MKNAKKWVALLLALTLLLTLAACAKNNANTNNNADANANANADSGSNTNANADSGSNTDANADSGSSTDISAELGLLNAGTIAVGMEISYPPFESMSSDGVTPEGYDIDLAKALAQKLGVEVQFINTSFDGIFAGLGVNYDLVISGVTINEDRKKEMLFSTPYISNFQAIVIRADSTDTYESLNDLTGKNVSLQKGTTSDELFNELVSTGTIDATVVANESVVTSLAMLSNGEVDACLCDSTVADVYVAKNPDLKIVFKDETEPEQFGIAIPMTNTAMQTAINKAMAELEAEGFFKESDSIWFG